MMQTAIFNPGLAYAEYNQRKAAYVLAALVAFFMSSYFVVGYLAGDLLFWGWDISQTMNGVVGIGICAVMTSYQFILYAQGDITGGRKATIVAVCVAVGFSLLSEVGQGMERDHIRMEAKSIESPTYQAIVGRISAAASGPVAHPYSAQLERAGMKLARCQEKVSAGEWEDCVESTARLQSVKKSITEFYQQNQQHAVTLANTAKTLEKDESNYHPLVNLIKSAINSTGVFASFILSLILIGFFEYAFHYLGRQLAAKKSELLQHGYDVTRRNRKTPKAFNINQDNNSPAPPENTWNDELSKHQLDSPADDALNQSADPEQAQRIIERGQSVPDTVPTPTGSASGTLSPESVGTVQNGEKRDVTDPESIRNSAYFKLIYAEIFKLVVSREIKPTVRPVTGAVTTMVRDKSHLLGIQSVILTKPIRQMIAQLILEKMENKGVVYRNPEGGVGKPKYLLSEKYRKQIVGTEEEQLNLMPEVAQHV
ncbi:MAG: hypothetical protein ACPGVP_21935 [Thiolinea sp.]